MEELRKYFPFDETEGWQIYRSWWHKRHERAFIGNGDHDLPIEWEVINLLADQNGWDLSQEEAFRVVEETCQEKYPSYPFDRERVQRMISRLHGCKDRHKQEQSSHPEKSEVPIQDSEPIEKNKG